MDSCPLADIAGWGESPVEMRRPHETQPGASNTAQFPTQSLFPESTAFHITVSNKLIAILAIAKRKVCPPDGASDRGNFPRPVPLPGKLLILWLDPECTAFFLVRCATRRNQLSAGRRGRRCTTSHSAHHMLLGKNKLAGISNKTMLSPHVVLRKDISTSHTDPE